MKRLTVRIEKQDDGTYIAYNIDNDKVALLGTGDRVSEAKDDFLNSMAEVKESYEERGNGVPEELMNEPEFHFDVSSLFEYYKIINVSALSERLGINASLMRQYKSGNTYISDARLHEIESEIHKIGKEFCSLSLF